MIFGRHSVLKRGCSTWDPKEVPQAEFQLRLDAVRGEMARQKLDALVIYGDNYSFADLCYLTNYFPKVRGGISVVPRDGAISLLLNIGSRDVQFAKTLTWVEDVRASNQVGADGAKLLKEKGFEKAKIGLMDSGLGFPLPQLEDMKGALPNVNWQACDAMIVPQRLVKTARELGAMREAGHLLSDICDGARAFIKQGRKEYEVIADIDRLARDKGAEDIRILADRVQIRRRFGDRPDGVQIGHLQGDQHAAVRFGTVGRRIQVGRLLLLRAFRLRQRLQLRANTFAANRRRSSSVVRPVSRICSDTAG